jgi:hypothetical protein
MAGLDSSWAGVRRVRFKANGFGLRGLGVNTVQGDHETKLVADLAGVDGSFLPAILTTSGKRMSTVQSPVLGGGRE